jgi:hypothetical protein
MDNVNHQLQQLLLQPAALSPHVQIEPYNPQVHLRVISHCLATTEQDSFPLNSSRIKGDLITRRADGLIVALLMYEVMDYDNRVVMLALASNRTFITGDDVGIMVKQFVYKYKEYTIEMISKSVMRAGWNWFQEYGFMLNPVAPNACQYLVRYPPGHPMLNCVDCPYGCRCNCNPTLICGIDEGVDAYYEHTDLCKTVHCPHKD